jgi:hypothetical protein
MAFEYVGPDRFEYPDEHADIARLVYKLWCLNYNAIYDDPKCYELYGHLVHLETKLVDSGALPHYFVNAIALKPAIEALNTVGQASLRDRFMNYVKTKIW